MLSDSTEVPGRPDQDDAQRDLRLCRFLAEKAIALLAEFSDRLGAWAPSWKPVAQPSLKHYYLALFVFNDVFRDVWISGDDGAAFGAFFVTQSLRVREHLGRILVRVIDVLTGCKSCLSRPGPCLCFRFYYTVLVSMVL